MNDVLVLASDAQRRDALRAELDDVGITSADYAIDQASESVIDARALILDREFVDELLASSTPLPPLIVIAREGSIPDAVQCMRQGATDYLAEPLSAGELVKAVTRALNKAGNPELASEPALWSMIGQCDAMLELFDRIRKVAPTETTVLIQGESGSGKELVARALHNASARRHAPMISLNCAAIPDSLIETELFGHEPGSVPGRTARQAGLIEAAHGGTLFLDEIGELPIEAQARLLQVLQDGETRRVGSTNSSRVDVRLITATHRDLKSLTEAQAFREDLFYRLHVVTLVVPPLRERGDDVVAIAQAVLERISQKLAKPDVRFADEALTTLKDYTWPGNVRELENAIERAVILCDSGTIDSELLAIDVELSPPAQVKTDINGTGSLEDYFVQFVLENQDQLTETELANRLGISRKSLWERRQRLSIPRRRTRKRGPRVST